MAGLRVLCLDGGGIRGYSSLVILAAIMRGIVYDDPTSGQLDDVYPCEYFDVIAGAGIGGVLALLLGRLRLTIPQCLAEYWKLSAFVVRDEGTPPICDSSKLLKVARRIVLMYEKARTEDEDLPSVFLQPPSSTGLPMTFAFGVSEDKPYCFRGHISNSGQVHSDLNPASIELDQAFLAILAAKGLFSKYELHDGEKHVRTFLDRPFPLGLSNPNVETLRELERESSQPINRIISIGCGDVADEDIPPLLLLGGIPMIPSYLSPMIPSYLPKFLFQGISVATAKRSVEYTRTFLQHEQEYADGIRAHNGLYHRFSIGPIKDVGPNDYLSIEEVGKASDEYVLLHKKDIEEIGQGIRDELRLKAKEA